MTEPHFAGRDGSFPRDPPVAAEECLTPISFTSSAREASRILLTWLKECSDGIVLMPASICETEREGSGIRDLILSSGAASDFSRWTRISGPRLR